MCPQWTDTHIHTTHTYSALKPCSTRVRVVTFNHTRLAQTLKAHEGDATLPLPWTNCARRAFDTNKGRHCVRPPPTHALRKRHTHTRTLQVPPPASRPPPSSMHAGCAIASRALLRARRTKTASSWRRSAGCRRSARAPGRRPRRQRTTAHAGYRRLGTWTTARCRRLRRPGPPRHP